MKKITVLISVLFLAGCATTNCDLSNNDASLLTKMNCDLSGQYRDVIDTKEKDLVDARETNEALRKIYAEIDAQLQDSEQSRQAFRSKNNSIAKSIQDLANELQKQDKHKNQLDSQLEDLQKSSQDLTQSDPADELEVQHKQAELKQLKSKLKQIEMSLAF